MISLDFELSSADMIPKFREHGDVNIKTKINALEIIASILIYLHKPVYVNI